MLKIEKQKQQRGCKSPVFQSQCLCPGIISSKKLQYIYFEYLMSALYCDFPYFQVRTQQTSKPVEIDEFLSFLDPLVIDSLRNGSGVPYQPSKAAALKRKCLAASELTISGVSDKTPFNFAPYNILQTPRYRLRSHFPFIF